MDSEGYIINCTVFTIEAVLTYLVYKEYRTQAACLKSLKAVQCLPLDAELKKTVESNNGEIKYVAVSGKIQAVASPLVSQYLPQLRGVIREKVTVERKIKWNPFLGIWGSTSNDILRSFNHVPFTLYDKASSLFRKKVTVDVLEPLAAKELVVPTVFDEFHCHHDTVGETVFGILRGEKTLGIREIEKLLCENEMLTAVGKLVVENDRLKIKPPDDGLTYFLTPLSLEALIDKVETAVKVCRTSSIVMSTVTLICFVYFSSLAYVKIKKIIERRRDRKKMEEQRRLRRMADRRNNDDAQVPKCLVCVENPVEVIILECGHICLCCDCSQHIKDLCPVCRDPISRTVSGFFP